MKRFLSLLLAIVMVVSLLPLDIAAAVAKHTEEYQEITAENWTASMIRQSAEEHHRVYYVLDASDGNYYPVEYAKMAYYLAAPTPVNIYGNFSAVSGTLFEASYGSLSRSEGHDDQMLYCYLGQSGGTSEGEMRAVYYNTNPKTGYYATTLFYYQNSLTGTDVQDLSTWNQALGNRTVQLLGASEEWEYGWQSGVGTTPFANSSYDGTLYYQYTQPEHDNAVYYTRGNDVRVELAMPKIGSDESVGYTGTLYYSPDGIDPETPQNTPELPSNDYYTVFSKNTSTLAPGVEQNIYYAETADDSQQMVFYTATVDLAREDLEIYANYNENDGNATGTSCLTDQIAAAARNHTDVENYTPVVGVNGDFFNLNTSVPSGVLAMEGEIFKENSSNRNFFAIKNDKTAMLGSAEDWQTVRDEVKEAIGVGDILVRDGQIVSSSSGANNRVARTCVGITSDGNVVLMVIDGRQEPFSCGGNYQEIAQIMLDAGCVQAANLDGGGSSTFAAREEGEDHIRVVNRPADGVERSISSSLLVVSTAKTADGGAAHPLIQADDGTLLGYFGVGGEVALPETVTVIGAAAFQNCQTVTKLTLPESVTEIGNSAFCDCKNLTDITLPNSLTGIGSSALQNCRSLTSAEIPNGVTSIESALFRRCANLESVAIPVSVTEIGENAFYGCSNLTDVYYAGTEAQWNGITIGSDNDPLESAEIHYNASISIASGTCGENLTWTLDENGLLTISGTGEMADYENNPPPWYDQRTSIQSVIIENGVTSIGDFAFYGCNILTSASLPDSVTSIGSYSFSLCRSLISIMIPDGVTRIEEESFSSCYSLTSVTIPDSVTSIGNYAFYECISLTNVTIPDSVTSIENNAFSSCRRLTSILIPASVTQIGSNAFHGCSSLTDVYYTGMKAQWNQITIGECENNPLDSATIHCADGDLSLIGYELADYLIDGAEYLIVSTNREGEAFALANNGGAVDAIPVTISNGIIKLTDSAAVWTVKLSSSILFTYRYALVNDGAYLISSVGLSLASSMGSSINAWTYDDGLKSGTSSLYYDSAEQRFSTSLSTNNRVYLFVKQGTNIGGACGETVSWALSEDGLLTISGAGEMSDYSSSIISTSNIAPWVQYRFRITSLSIDDGVTRIGNNAFAQLSNLRGTLLIPESVTSIGNSAFSGCGGLTGELVIPESVTSIGNSAFSSCSGFTGELVIPENVTSIGNYAFSGCSGFTGELVIPDGIQDLNKKAFGGMTGVTSIVVGEQVRSIFTSAEEPETNPFGGSTSVTEIKFRGETVPTLTEDASPFDSLTSLERIIVPAAAYDDYIAAYSKYLPEGAEIVPDGALARVHGLSADRVYSKTAALSWDADADGVIAGYKVLRDGTEIGDVTDCAFVDRALEPGLTYTYTVRGYAADGRVTLPAAIEVTTAEPRVTDIQTENSLNKIGLTNNTVTIYAADTNNLLPLGDERTTGELYYVLDGHRSRIGEAQLGENGVYTIHWDVTDVQDGEYTLVFVLTDVDGSSDEYSEKVTVDRTRPAKIVGVAAIADETVIHLTWSISAEVETSRYNIYRRAEDEDAFRRLTQITSRNTLSYTDSNVEKGKVYEYYVVGVNAVDVESAEYDVVGAALLDDTAAPTVTRLIPANATYLTGRKDLGIRAEDNVSVTRSAIYYSLDGGESWTLVDERSSGEWSVSFDTTALPDGEMRVKGVAFDAAGNESDPLVYVYSIDNTGPARVEGVTWESTSVTATLRWNDVADDDIRFYRVERLQSDGTYALVTDVNGTLGANLYNLAPETSYTYRVVGYDLRGNRGVPSEDVTVTTQADTTNPVITSIRPLSGSYNTSIPVVLKASDEYGVQRIVLQTSVDGMEWTDAAEQTYTTVQKDRTWSYTLSLADYAEGALYVRGVAADFAGNESDTGETAPFVQHLVDKTAPAAPQQVAARGDNGYVEISWVQGPEPDLNTYTVWRASVDSGTFTAIASGIRAINCFDRNAAAGVTYWYYVTVTDKTGNVSAASETVSAAALTDVEAPRIVSIYPASGEAVGAGYRTVSVLARDNRSLDRVVIEYSADGETFRTLKTGSNLNTYSTTVTAQIPLSEFSDGDTVWLRARAYDASGSVSEDASASYVVDLTAPALSGASAQYADGGVTVQWTGGMENDLAGYRIYRRAANGSSYSLIAQRQAVSGQSRYSCTDYGISLAGASYVYKIEAMDSCGNIRSVETASVTVPDRTAPTPKLSCESVMEVGVEYVFDATASKDDQAIAAWHFDFGDGTESHEAAPIHVYDETGSYTVRLTVTDDEGNESVLIKEITVRDRTAVGTVRIHITDEYGQAVPNAPVYFDLGSDEQVVRGTDSAGNVTFTAAIGRHIVGCVIADNEWLPAKKEVIVTAGETTTISMTLVHHPMIEGQFEIKRMTFEEIVAAGIDVSKPENQYVVKMNGTLNYGEQQINTSFIYNERTHQTIARPTIVTTPAAERRKITPVVLYYDRADEDNGSGVAKPAEATIAYLDVPLSESYLKDFFYVKLHIINNAAESFRMTDNVVTLNVPQGLTLMDTEGSESSATVQIPEIKGQTTTTLTWILRGDETGSYLLTADYSGILAEFNEPIKAHFVAEDPIVVNVDSAKLSPADEYIIQEVRKYTAGQYIAQYLEIFNGGYNGEETFRRVTEFFNNDGITDVHEGVKYVTEAHPYTLAYRGLMTSDMFCANNYYHWLNETPSGKRARNILCVDGLIFNFEATSYFNPATYIESDYPGVKKNKMLLKMIMEGSKEDDEKDLGYYTERLAMFVDSALELNGDFLSEVIEKKLYKVMDQIIECKSVDELDKLQNQFAELLVKGCEAEAQNTLNLKSNPISSLLGTGSKIIKLGGATVSDLMGIIDLDKDIALYQRYARFLTAVENDTGVSNDMRMAAHSLLDDINNGYLKKISVLLVDMINNGKDFLFTDASMIETALVKMGFPASGVNALSKCVATLTLATFVSNFIINTGDFVKQVAYTQGFAELALLYERIVNADKEAFLQNQSAGNAWKFFEDYSMLWYLRYRGEEQYLKMNEVKMFLGAKVHGYNYNEKEEVVNDNLKWLENHQFRLDPDIEVPTSIPYVKKSVIHCPVDVDVYLENGDLLLTLRDGAESNVVNEYGRFTVVRESYSGEYVKVICQSTNDNLSFKLRAVDEGLVDYVQSSTDSGETTAFDKVIVSEGDTISLHESTYVVESSSGTSEEAGYLVKQNDSYAPVEDAVLSRDSAQLKPGERMVIGVQILPQNATNTAVDWFSADDSVAKIQNGVLEAVAPGETTIYARICDADHEIVLELSVSVEAEQIANPFKDVPEGKYYHDAVLWALDNGVTTGVTPNTFVPDKNCTRAQVVTFLWRAAGKPEPESMENPFRDVSASAYYLKAVLWARENGITTGTTPPTFDPNAECTRAQVVTFLWRANRSPDPTSTTNPFKDVSASAYYFKAVLWALENGVTTGKTPTTFNPDGVCTRAHVVTFLYRSMT